MPAVPTATARVAEAKAALASGTLEAVIGVAVSPPSIVRFSSPLSVVMRHVSASAQRIDVSRMPLPNGRFVKVAPPSVLRMSVPWPMP